MEIIGPGDLTKVSSGVHLPKSVNLKMIYVFRQIRFILKKGVLAQESEKGWWKRKA